MQPTAKPTKAAIYVKGRDAKKIDVEVKKLNEYLINDGCSLDGPDQVYVDGDGSLEQLAKLVKQARQREVRVVYVVHDLLGKERTGYRALTDELYNQGVSILVCE